MAMMKDPVCGMEIDERTAPAKTTYQGQTYNFCSSRCKEAFEKEPEKHVAKARAPGGH